MASLLLKQIIERLKVAIKGRGFKPIFFGKGSIRDSFSWGQFLFDCFLGF
jgi:hypothetical protein